MSIAVAIAVPDGIALAADTQTTWLRSITKAREKGSGREFELETPIKVPLGWSRMARKLFALSFAGHPYALATAGAAVINGKTPYAIARQLEASYRGPEDFDSVRNHLVEGIQTELRAHHGVVDLAAAPPLAIDFMLAAFGRSGVADPLLASHCVYSGSLDLPEGAACVGSHHRWQNQGAHRYGSCWIGHAAFVSHVVEHKNPDLPPISGQYQFMSLADAVDYATFLVRFTCDFQRFAIMIPDAGRPIVSATLTPEGYVEKVLDT
jgi:hypothetical protein